MSDNIDNISASPELTCQQLVELVTDYLEEAVSDLDRARFEYHLEDCGYCRRYVDQFRRTIGIVGTLRQTPIAPDRKQELLDLFRSWKHHQ